VVQPAALTSRSGERKKGEEKEREEGQSSDLAQRGVGWVWGEVQAREKEVEEKKKRKARDIEDTVKIDIEDHGSYHQH